MGLATLISRLLGLVREQVFAYLFGAGQATDAFQVAFRIPNLFRDLFAEGAMSAALVPVFTQVREAQGQLRAWRLAGLVFRVLFIGVSLFTAFSQLFAEQWVALYAAGFKAVPGKFELTVGLTRVLFPFFPWVALAAAFMGVLNASGVFFLPSLASAFFNGVSITVGVLLAAVISRFGGRFGWDEPIYGMAWGVIIGGMVQALVQLPALYQIQYRWPKKLATDPPWWQEPALGKMLLLMVPGTLGLAATSLNVLVNTVLATSQPVGSVSYLNYAFRLMQFPIGLFGVSLAQATLPQVSLLWAKQQQGEGVKVLTKSLKMAFALNVPAAAGLAVLAQPIVALLFQYGRFGEHDMLATSRALVMYAFGLPAYSAVKVLVPVCYAMGNTRLPVAATFLTVAVTLSLNSWWVERLGFWSLALGTSVAAGFNLVWLLWALKRALARQGWFWDLKPLLGSFFRASLLSLVMTGAITLSQPWVGGVLPGEGLFFRLMRLALLMVVGAGVLGGVASVMQAEEWLEVVRLVREKRQKSRHKTL